MKLAIMSCFWNPNKSVRVAKNLDRFAEWLYKFPHTYIFYVPDDAEQFIFQKEAGLNIAAQHCFDKFECDAIAWLDADITFLRDEWFDATVDELSRHPVCQLFEICHMMDPLGQIVQHSKGYQYDLADGNAKPAAGQGFAWAARRQVFEAGGLFDLNPSGGGDAMMAAAWNNRPGDFGIAKTSNQLREAWEAWRQKQHEVVNCSVGYLHGDILHHYHGAIQNRQYTARTHLLKTYSFNPATDIARDQRGLLRWTGVNQKLETAITGLFAGRREDD